jgi:hypothetical protein
MYYKIDGSNGMVQVIQPSTTTTTTTTGEEVSPQGQITPLPEGKNDKAYPGHSY